MQRIADFFSYQNTVREISSADLHQTFNYLEPIKAFARTTNKCVFIIDYQKKGFDYVSDHPLFLCGHSGEEVEKLGYEFYLQYVLKEDLELLLSANNAGFDFYDKLPLPDRKKHVISYDFRLKNKENKIIFVHQELTPLFLTAEGKIWKALCIVSLAIANRPGNIQIYKEGDNKVFKYHLEEKFWSTTLKIELTERELEILRLSARGFTMNDIAKALFISPDTVKFHKKKFFEKLDVSNVSEAIAVLSNNRLL
jgi:DNA-binding CsgD family transcriptional regulator